MRRTASAVTRLRWRLVCGDGLAVQQGTITAGGLNRMADGVAEIEKHAHTELPFIQTDYLGLDPDGDRDHLLERGGIALVKGLAMALNEAKERGVPDEPGLDALVNPGA